jgi:hypothetical protein
MFAVTKLVDWDANGDLSAGDRAVMGNYPENFAPTYPDDFGRFAVSYHEVTNVSTRHHPRP